MHKEILPIGMFDLLADLMKYLLDPDKEFRLVGGTALALQLGHRLSVDIDLFTHRSFDTAALLMRLREDFSGVEEAYESANGLNLVLHGIKLDIYNWGVPFAEPPVVFEGIRMASLRDIAAFKLDAIKRRQTKKDFYDLYFLFQLFPLRELLAHYKQMFGFASLTGPLNGLTAEYLERAAESDEPVLLKPVPFEAVQAFIAQTVRDYMESLDAEKAQQAALRDAALQQLIEQRRLRNK